MGMFLCYSAVILCPSSLRTNLLNFGTTSSSNFPLDEVKIVRSTRLFERQSKKRRSSKPQVMVSETCRPRKSDTQRKLNEGFNPHDPLRLFLWGPETRQLLTVKEESECIVQIQVFSSFLFLCRK